ncbi:uncharacterized protein [Littorina saxatilis]
MKCKLPVGDNCIGRGRLCMTGSVCEVLGNKCKVKIGNKCAEDKEKQCESGSVCDVNQTCRVSKGASCSGSRSSFCQRGTVCDSFGQCKVGTGCACTTTGKSEECVAGAACVQSVCACNASVSVPNGLLCEAKEGRARSPCSSVLPCQLPHTYCRDGRCGCEAGMTLNSRDYSCEGTPLSLKDTEAASTAAVISSLGSVILLTVCFYGTLLCIRARRYREAENLHRSAQNRAQPPDKPTTSTTGKVPSPQKKRKHSPAKKPKQAIAAPGTGVDEVGSAVDANEAPSTKSVQPEAKPQASSQDADSILSSNGTTVDGVPSPTSLAQAIISGKPSPASLASMFSGISALTSILTGSEKSNTSEVPKAAAEEMPTSSETPKAASEMPKAVSEMPKAAPSEMPKATEMPKASEMPKAEAPQAAGEPPAITCNPSNGPSRGKQQITIF